MKQLIVTLIGHIPAKTNSKTGAPSPVKQTQKFNLSYMSEVEFENDETMKDFLYAHARMQRILNPDIVWDGAEASQIKVVAQLSLNGRE